MNESGPAFSPASKSAQIADAIRRQIVAGELKAGDALPPESALTEIYGASQHTVRSALRLLESDGLVRVHRGARGGGRVQALEVDAIARQAGLYLQLDGADLTDLLEALLLLQPGAVQLAASRRTNAQLRQLRQCAERAYRAASMKEFSEEAANFVVLLLEASGNRSIKLFAQVIRALIHEELHRHLDDRVADIESVQWNARRFAELVDLIEAGEGEAAAALWRAHMLATVPSATKRSRPRRLAMPAAP